VDVPVLVVCSIFIFEKERKKMHTLEAILRRPTAEYDEFQDI
jgi:hypothetical protein